jgi:hypothetical protein
MSKKIRIFAKPTTMKTKKLTTLLLGFFATLCLVTQCDKEDLLELPPETQIGANTFGALVNEVLFVKGRGTTFGRPLDVSFDEKIKRLHISCVAAGEQFKFMDLIIDEPHEGENILFVGYLTTTMGTGGRNCWGFGCENCGKIFITKFDTINRIVSGTFEFSGRCADVLTSSPIRYIGDSIVHITNGRFDVRFNLNNN